MPVPVGCHWLCRFEGRAIGYSFPTTYEDGGKAACRFSVLTLETILIPASRRVDAALPAESARVDSRTTTRVGMVNCWGSLSGS